MIDHALFRVHVPQNFHGWWEVRRWQLLRPTEHMGFMNPPGTYTALLRWDTDYLSKTWMSDLPSEAECAIPFVEQAHGHVLVTGLGLGSILRPLLARPEVETVTVIEREADVAALVWPTYSRDPKLSIIIGDALRPKRLRLPRARWTCAWHDIWRDLDPRNLPRMLAMRRRWDVEGLVMCWSEPQVRAKIAQFARDMNAADPCKEVHHEHVPV